MTDTRDGQTYKTVTIGKQTWMAENLNYDPGDVSSLGSYAWHGCYNDDANNCVTYGRLYTWEVTMNDAACAYGNTCNPSGTVQGICPEGWYVPSDAEWNTLWAAVGGCSTAGAKFKSTTGWDNYGNGIDEYGFSVLPAGVRIEGNFYDQGEFAQLWSASENYSDYATSQGFNDRDDDLVQYYPYKNSANSLRCIQDSN